MLIAFMMRVIDPSSHVFGAVSLIASIGTIIALLYTIKTVRSSEKQAEIESAKRSMDSVLHLIENELKGVVYYKAVHSMNETHFGREAIYRAGLVAEFGFHRGTSNYLRIKKYLDYLIEYSITFKMLLLKIEDRRIRLEYFSKIGFEIDFSNESILPLYQSYIDKPQDGGPSKYEVAVLIKHIEELGKFKIDFYRDLFDAKSS